MKNTREIEELSKKLSQMTTQADRIELLVESMWAAHPRANPGPRQTMVTGFGMLPVAVTPKVTPSNPGDAVLELVEQYNVQKQVMVRISEKILKGTILGEDPWSVPISVVPCANVNPQIHERCSNAGSRACANCRLALYCSSTCQKAHWKLHKYDCKFHLNRKDWAPSWIRENREPIFSMPMVSPTAFDLHSGHGAVGLGKSLWGNVPAIDLLNLEANEGRSYQEDLSLAFVASGDLRNVLLTVNSIPPEYTGKVSIVINDFLPQVAARNLLILLVIAEIPDEALAADVALHLWYSAFIPEEYDTRILHVAALALGDIEKTSHGMRLDRSYAERMHIIANFTPDTGAILAGFIAQGIPLNTANTSEELMGVMSHRRDYHDRYNCTLRPSHRMAMREYRSTGILLPFGAANAHFNTTNKTLFTPSGKWLQDDMLYPTSGWNLTEVIAAGRPHGATPQDLFGCLYFYLTEQLLKFKKQLNTLKITFHLTDAHSSVLAAHLQGMVSKSPHSSHTESPFSALPTSFDRIDVSNTVDDNYVGFTQTFKDWGTVLKEQNPCSTLLTYSMNWVWAEPNGKPDADNNAMARITQQLFRDKKFEHIPVDQMTTTWSPATMIIHRASAAMYENSQAFERYLSKKHAYESASKHGLRLKPQHTITPRRRGIPLETPLQTLPAFANEEEWYEQICLSRHSFFDRFQEFSRSST